ncbi:MAG: FKBP-type peptidyl-prolyl cis-trans isomerase [Bdellovibrionales bacterium]
MIASSRALLGTTLAVFCLTSAAFAEGSHAGHSHGPGDGHDHGHDHGSHSVDPLQDILANAPKRELTAEEKMMQAEQEMMATYLIGYQVGQQLKENLQHVKFEDFVTGLRDAAEGKKPAVDAEEGAKAMAVFHEIMKERAEEMAKAASAANLKIGEAFYKEQDARKETKKTESGLLYEVLTEGKKDGKKPGPTDKVTVNYEGTLIDGTVFDSSYARGKPTSFPLNRVISGWTEGLQLMKPGATYRFVIPPALAYGKRGAGADIGPDATLIFKVELISIDGPEKPRAGSFSGK